MRRRLPCYVLAAGCNPNRSRELGIRTAVLWGNEVIVRSRGALVMALAAGMLLTGTAAVAQEDAPPPEVAVGDHVYGPEDGVRIESGSTLLQSAFSQTRYLAARSGSTKYTRGKTWVSTEHPNDLSYMGAAEAWGNVYQKSCYIRASFKYTRNGADLIGWQSSTAKQTGCTWSGGPLVTKTVMDSLDPNAPQTKFRYDFVSMPSTVC